MRRTTRGPGVPVLRSLRDGARAGERRIGLTYDALDPASYTRDLADQVFLLTYPSAGAHAFLDRLLVDPRAYTAGRDHPYA